MVTDQKSKPVTLMSFGFKHGTPNDVNIIMDVRFLQNPHWVEDLKPLSGLDKGVGDYIRQDPKFDAFIENFTNILKPLLAHHTDKNQNDITIAIGCTGGRHRSVFTVETLSEWIKNRGYESHVEHRDLGG